MLILNVWNVIFWIGQGIPFETSIALIEICKISCKLHKITFARWYEKCLRWMIWLTNRWNTLIHLAIFDYLFKLLRGFSLYKRLLFLPLQNHSSIMYILYYSVLSFCFTPCLHHWRFMLNIRYDVCINRTWKARV